MSTRKKARRPSLKGSLNPSKRHRDRVNIELDNLAKLLPFPPEVIAKLDKLSVLRLSASYLRTKNFFKGLGVSSKSETSTPDDFEKAGTSDLLLEALDGFLMVLTQDMEIFYASETISDFLGVSQASVIHQDFLRFVHVDDQDMLQNNLKLVPSPPEQKIREITDDDDAETSAENSDSTSNENGKEESKERSFVCRFKCILNTNAGFFKPFKCHGRLREVDVPDSPCPQLALFLVCSPLEMSTSIIEVRMKSMLFCTKNKLDLTFMDIDQKGRQIVGYTKKDLSAQSSYCMMHYDDIPVLKKMHSDLISTGKCDGVFRWLNKNMKWQWLNGTGQVIFKNNRPDFVITTNKPLSDEEGDDEVRRRERDLAMIPTSPASLLSHLQLASPPLPISSSPHPPHMTNYTPGPSVSSSHVSPGLSTTCTSEPFPVEDLPWDLNTESLFDAAGGTWDSRAPLSDLDDIGKGDLVDLFQLDVNDLNLDTLDESNTVPLTHASESSYPPSEISPNPPMPSQTALWMPGDPRMVNNGQPMTSQYPAPYSQPVSVANSGMATSYRVYADPRVPATGGVMLGVGAPGKVSLDGVPPRFISRNGISTNGPFVNVSDPMMTSSMASSQPLPPHIGSNLGSSGLLQVQTQPMVNRTYIKTEPARSAGYYCTSMDTGLPGGVTNGLSFPGVVTSQANTNYRYQNRLNHGRPPQWTTAPLSPYSSSSSSTSSYDALHVQFSPTDILTSPFSSPRDDNDYNHGIAPPSVPFPGQPYSNGRNPQRSFSRPPPSFPQPFVDIPEIAPMGMVEDIFPGMHRTSPISSRGTTGLTHL